MLRNNRLYRLIVVARNSIKAEGKTIKVLEITGEPIFYGGQEVFIFNFISHLEDENIKVDVLTPYTCNNENFRNIIRGKGEIYEFGQEFAPGKSRSGFNEPLREFLKEHKYDVVHVHSGSTSILAYASKIARERGVKKVIVHSHCNGIASLKTKAVKMFFSSYFYKYPTNLCACSPEAGYWKFPKKLVDKKLEFILNGVDLEKFKFSPEVRKEIRESLGLTDKDFVVGHVGRFEYQKNHKFLVEIFNEFQKNNENAKLLLVGDGELKETVKQQVKVFGIEDKVFYSGNVNNTNSFYSAMDVFCLPSVLEGYPIVCVEAAASGLKLIVSDHMSRKVKDLPGLEMISLDEQSPDFKPWVDALKAVSAECSSETERKAATDRMQDFDIKTTADKLVKLYRG